MLCMSLLYICIYTSASLLVVFSRLIISSSSSLLGKDVVALKRLAIESDIVTLVIFAAKDGRQFSGEYSDSMTRKLTNASVGTNQIGKKTNMVLGTVAALRVYIQLRCTPSQPQCRSSEPFYTSHLTQSRILEHAIRLAP